VRGEVGQIAALCVLLTAAAAPEGDAGAVAVDFDSVDSAGSWYASALEETVERELSRFHRIELLGKIDHGVCPDRDPRCLLAAYRSRGAKLVVTGELDGHKLKYAVYDALTETKAAGGSLEVHRTSSATLKRKIGDIVRPIVQRGGLLDLRRSIGERSSAPLLDRTPALLPYVIVLLILIVLSPILLTALISGSEVFLRHQRPVSWSWAGVLVGSLAILAIGAFAVPRPFAEGVGPIAAGMLWGAFLVINLGWVLAPIHGLSRVRHDALRPLLESWIELALLRASLLLAYVPLLMLARMLASAMMLPDRITYALIFPAAGLIADFWLLAVVEALAIWLDGKRVHGIATERNPWHGTIKRYFMGYVRRNGVELDRELLDRVLFLPSLSRGVVSYGGGFARPRILIGDAVREAALGELPEETEAPDRTVNPEELPFGLLAPQRSEDRDWLARGGPVDALRRQLTLAPPRGRGPIPRLIGESATLLGWVLPQTKNESVPLIANTTEDFDVVKRLLTKHYAAFATNIDDEDIDDTDPTQKDLLFGALLREIGTFRRGDAILGTLRMSLELASVRASFVGRALIRGSCALYDRLLSGPAAMVADAYVALNHGFHHLIQYIDFERGGAVPLTARADLPQLMRTSKEILERLGKTPRADEDRRVLGATTKNRLVWLSRFFYKPLALRAPRRLRIAVVAAMTLVAGIFILQAVQEAIDYHPTYVERIAKANEGAAPDDRAQPHQE
jgi:hypothetical protein